MTNSIRCCSTCCPLIDSNNSIVNNSILLLDFILKARARGVPKQEAILQSVRLRIRPILMTTTSTVVGLMPLVMEMAVGLERMSPLGIVAATGLIVGTFMTMVIIPVFYSTFDSLAQGIGSFWRYLTAPGDTGCSPTSGNAGDYPAEFCAAPDNEPEEN